MSRILFITPQPYFAHRGSPLRVRSTVSILVSLGYEVDLLVYPFGEDNHMPGVILHRSSVFPGIKHVPIGPSLEKFLLDIRLFRAAQKLAASNRYSVVHGVEEAVFVARKISRRYGIPYVMDMHSSMPDQLAEVRFPGLGPLRAIFRMLEKQAIRDAHGIITVSDELSNYALKIAPKTIVHTAHDLPLDSSRYVDSSLTSYLTDSLNTDGRKVVLYTGNLKHYQGIELLLHAVAHLLRTEALHEFNGKLLVLIVGGNIEERREKETLESLARTLGIEDAVHFVGHVSSNEMGNYFALGDVLVSPRISGTNTPLKVYSYIQAGKPIVATDIRSHTQVLSDAEAYLCNPTAESMAKALAVALSDDPAEVTARADRVERAKERLLREYSPEHFAKKLGEVYDEVTRLGARINKASSNQTSSAPVSTPTGKTP